MAFLFTSRTPFLLTTTSPPYRTITLVLYEFIASYLQQELSLPWRTCPWAYDLNLPAAAGRRRTMRAVSERRE